MFLIPGSAIFLEIRKEPGKLQWKLTAPQVLFKTQYVGDILISYEQTFPFELHKIYVNSF